MDANIVKCNTGCCELTFLKNIRESFDVSIYNTCKEKVVFEKASIKNVIQNGKCCYFQDAETGIWWGFEDDHFLTMVYELGEKLFDFYFIMENKHLICGSRLCLFFQSWGHICKHMTYKIVYNNDFMFIGDEGFYALVRGDEAGYCMYEIEMESEDTFMIFQVREEIVRESAGEKIIFRRADVLEKDVFELIYKGR